MSSPVDPYPQVLLFDIGGVCVVSPMQAILDYERAHGIPIGWINFAIAASSPDGWWARLERGEVQTTPEFFAGFHADLSDPVLWRQYYARQQAKGLVASEPVDDSYDDAATPVIPPVPAIDAEWLFWEMARISREFDPHMFPALRRLRKVAEERRRGQTPGRRLVLAALSNTFAFPPGHAFNDPRTPEGAKAKELRDVFDVFVSSSHVGMRKPAEDIYKYAVTRLQEHVRWAGAGAGVRPQDVTFFDDIGGNLRTAQKLGMQTVKVQLGRTDLAVLELEKITGLNLRSDQPKL